MTADGAVGRRAEDTARSGPDLRLLGPALLAWCSAAGLLTAPPALRAGVAGGCATAALLLILLARRRGRPTGGTTLPGRRWVSPVALALACAALVLAASAGHQGVRDAGPVGELALQGATVTVEGRVAADPVLRTMPGSGERYVSARLLVQGVSARGRHTRVRTLVDVRAPQSWSGVDWHSRVRVDGRLRPGRPGRPEAALLVARGKPTVLARAGPVARGAETLRARLRQATRPLPADARGLLPALVIGDTSQTPPDLTAAMVSTGMSHLSAVSGTNVSLVLAAALGAARLAGAPRRARPVLAGAVLAGFVVLARPEPSVVRAAVMGGVGLLALGTTRRAAGLPALASAVVLLLVFDPWLARSYGFALSALATLGMLVLVPEWGQAIGNRLPERIRSWGPALAIPCAAQAMCAPVVVLLQSSVSVIGVPANLLAAPLVAPTTVCGVAAALVAILSPDAATLVAWCGAVPAIGIARVARACAAVPGGSFPWPDGARGALMLAVLTALVVLAGPAGWHLARVRPRLAGMIALLAVAGTVPTTPVVWPPHAWRAVFCDVGEGDATVLRSGAGRAVVVDTGPEPGLIRDCLRDLGVQRVDAVVLTHFHADHVSGLPGVLGRWPVGQVLVTPIPEPAGEARAVRRACAAHAVPVHPLVAGDRLQVGEVGLDVWWPARRIDAGSVPNNASVVLAVRTGPAHLLVLADVEPEATSAIRARMAADPTMQATAARLDVVRTPHHGSGNVDPAFLAQVRAPVAVISVGRSNDYGHPSRRQLDVLTDLGSQVHRTDQQGAISVVELNGGIGIVGARPRPSEADVRKGGPVEPSRHPGPGGTRVREESVSSRPTPRLHCARAPPAWRPRPGPGAGPVS